MKHEKTSKSKSKLILVVISFCLFAALAGILTSCDQERICLS